MCVRTFIDLPIILINYHCHLDLFHVEISHVGQATQLHFKTGIIYYRTIMFCDSEPVSYGIVYNIAFTAGCKSSSHPEAVQSAFFQRPCLSHCGLQQSRRRVLEAPTTGAASMSDIRTFRYRPSHQPPASVSTRHLCRPRHLKSLLLPGLCKIPPSTPSSLEILWQTALIRPYFGVRPDARINKFRTPIRLLSWMYRVTKTVMTNALPAICGRVSYKYVGCVSSQQLFEQTSGFTVW